MNTKATADSQELLDYLCAQQKAFAMTITESAPGAARELQRLKDSIQWPPKVLDAVLRNAVANHIEDAAQFLNGVDVGTLDEDPFDLWDRCQLAQELIGQALVLAVFLERDVLGPERVGQLDAKVDARDGADSPDASDHAHAPGSDDR